MTRGGRRVGTSRRAAAIGPSRPETRRPSGRLVKMRGGHRVVEAGRASTIRVVAAGRAAVKTPRMISPPRMVTSLRAVLRACTLPPQHLHTRAGVFQGDQKPKEGARAHEAKSLWKSGNRRPATPKEARSPRMMDSLRDDDGVVLGYCMRESSAQRVGRCSLVWE